MNGFHCKSFFAEALALSGGLALTLMGCGGQGGDSAPPAAAPTSAIQALSAVDASSTSAASVAASASAPTAELGVYEGTGSTGVADLATFVTWSGHKPTRTVEFLDFSTWPKMESAANWALPFRKGYKLTLSLPLTATGTALADVAAGKHDASFSNIAQALIANGQADAIVRLGWEANGSWYPWAAKASPSDYIAAFRHVVGVMRGVAGNHFRFDWCTAQGWLQIVQPNFYPGDDVVDIIGEDIYAQTYATPLTWATMKDQLNRNYTLNWLPVFAAQHGKPVSIPEWGTGNGPSNHGLGDSPEFVSYMLNWIATHDVVYADYWDYAAKDYNSKVSDGEHPLAGAALKAGLADTFIN